MSTIVKVGDRVSWQDGFTIKGGRLTRIVGDMGLVTYKEYSPDGKIRTVTQTVKIKELRLDE